MKNTIIVTFLLFIIFKTAVADQQVVNNLINSYQNQGAKSANALQGEKLWTTEFVVNNQMNKRSCSSCHTANLQNQGKHVSTGNKIKAMAPSVNPLSLSKAKKIKKWLKRNCKWTLGRECNVQEKADLLAYINQQ